MRITWDKSVDAAYIHLTGSNDGKSYGHMVAVDPAEAHGVINLDFDSDGRLIGLEILDAKNKLAPETLAFEASTFQHLYYQLLEAELRSLLGRVREKVSSETIELVEEYLDHGEYGLVLDEILSGLPRIRKILTQHDIGQIEILASVMAVPESRLIEVRALSAD